MWYFWRLLAALPGIVVWGILGWPYGAAYGGVWILLAWVVWGFITAWKERTKGGVRP